MIARDLHHLKRLKMIPTRAGMNHYLMQIGSPSQSNDQWKLLPELEGANKLRQRGAISEVLAKSEEGFPLLIAQPIGQGRVAALAVDTTFLWHLGGFEKAHQRFWRQMILWLSRKEADTDKPVWVRVEPRNYSPHQQVDIEMGARDVKGKPINDADFVVTLFNPNGEQQQLTSRKLMENRLPLISTINLPAITGYGCKPFVRKSRLVFMPGRGLLSMLVTLS